MPRHSASDLYRGASPTALAILIDVFCMELQLRTGSRWPVPSGRPANLLDLKEYERDFKLWKRTNPIASRLCAAHRKELRRIGYELDDD
jgi:hypothetical protein